MTWLPAKLSFASFMIDCGSKKRLCEGCERLHRRQGHRAACNISELQRVQCSGQMQIAAGARTRLYAAYRKLQPACAWASALSVVVLAAPANATTLASNKLCCMFACVRGAARRITLPMGPMTGSQLQAPKRAASTASKRSLCKDSPHLCATLGMRLSASRSYTMVPSGCCLYGSTDWMIWTYSKSTMPVAGF